MGPGIFQHYLVTSTKKFGYLYSAIYTDRRRAEWANDNVFGRENPIEEVPFFLDHQLWYFSTKQQYPF